MSTFASSSDASSSDALARCAAFQREAAIEGAAAAIEDGAGASGAAHDLFVERFVAFAVLQERHRAGRLLAGDATAAAAAPAAAAVPPAAAAAAVPDAPHPVFFEPRAEALYRSMPSDRFEAPLETRRRGRSYRVVRTDAPALAPAAARDLARRCAVGMVGAFSDGGSTVLGCLEPSALEARVGADAAATIERAVGDLRALVGAAAGIDARRLRLSGAFVARLRPPAPARRRRAFEAPKPKPYWNVHVDEFNVASYEHTALLYLSDDFEGGRFAMYDGDGGDRVHAPRAGDVLAFSGDASNLHRVERVAAGCRFALTALFHEGDPGPVFAGGAKRSGSLRSWDDALRSAAEVSLAAQDPRRDALLDDADATPLASRLAGPDVRLDVSDARVRYDGPAPATAGPADATLAALAAAVLRARGAADGGDGGAWAAFGSDDDDDGGSDDGGGRS